jgi:hypothetical protein
MGGVRRMRSLRGRGRGQGGGGGGAVYVSLNCLRMEGIYKGGCP